MGFLVEKKLVWFLGVSYSYPCMRTHPRTELAGSTGRRLRPASTSSELRGDHHSHGRCCTETLRGCGESSLRHNAAMCQCSPVTRPALCVDVGECALSALMGGVGTCGEACVYVGHGGMPMDFPLIESSACPLFPCIHHATSEVTHSSKQKSSCTDHATPTQSSASVSNLTQK
jgi:hypothetical protein